MATLRNKKKLAAVSRATPEGSRSSRGHTVLDPELTQDYISQVSEEIEGRVIKKVSREFSKTESRILAALSKLDEFLLNPQVRTCSVAVQGSSGNANSENRETHGDRSSNDPYPEVGYFPRHSGQLNSPETETNSHVVTETYPHNCGILKSMASCNCIVQVFSMELSSTFQFHDGFSGGRRKYPNPKHPKSQNTHVQNTQGQNTHSPKVPKIEITTLIKYLTAS